MTAALMKTGARPLAAPAEVEKYSRILNPWDGYTPNVYGDSYARLIPEGDLAKLTEWVSASLAPTSAKDATELAAILLGAFSEQRLNDADAFGWHLSNLLAEYPPTVVQEVVREYPRKQKWLDIATVYELLEAKIQPTRRARAVIEMHANEYERRRAAEAKDRERAAALAAQLAAYQADFAKLPAFLEQRGVAEPDLKLLAKMDTEAQRYGGMDDRSAAYRLVEAMRQDAPGISTLFYDLAGRFW